MTRSSVSDHRKPVAEIVVKTECILINSDKMTIITDSVQIKNGTDYSFVCGKVPFAITCASNLQHGSYNLIDLDLVTKMKIPLQKIKVCRMTYLGENVRSVGYIDQTVSCVHKGVVQGTVHLSAKVVRNLFDNFNVDCVASSKTYERLVGNKPPDPPDEEMDVDDDKQHNEKLENEEDYSSTSSSGCSDGRHEPVSKEWLFRASLIAQTAQQDSADTLLQIENAIANGDLKEDDENEEDDEEDDHDSADTKTKDERSDTDEKEEDLYCDTCFRKGQPLKIVSNHTIDCPTCPSVTPEMKAITLGPNWKADAEYIFKRRYERQMEERRSHARP